LENKQTIRGTVRKITRITKTENVFDIQVSKNHNFFANDVLIHNCAEILLRDRQMCNLSEVVVRVDDTVETLKKKITMATILGTMQSTLTNFRYLSGEWQKNCEEERLLGVSLTGIMDNPILNGITDREKLPEILTELREHARKVNKIWAKKLGINEAAAITTNKPSGTVSLLVNSSSGIHPRWSKYYIRSVRITKDNPLAKFMVEAGFPYEPDVTKPDHTLVFYFPVAFSGEESKTVFRKDLDAIEQLELWKIYREHWTEHNPSITVYIREEEWLKVGSWVYDNFDEIGGISFLPYTDHIYAQAPYTEISEEEYKTAEENMPKDVDWPKLAEFEKKDMTISSQEFACSGGSCEITDLINK
jgi:ribonucleoside-triphosphate reductase (thioredoxin)